MSFNRFYNIIFGKKFRRVIPLLAMLFAVLLFYKPMKVHAANCSIAFGSTSYEHDDDESFQIGVYIKSDYGAASYSVVVRYDTDYIKYVSGADSADTTNGAIQLTGMGAQNSIQRMVNFQAVNPGEFKVYAESADVYYFPLTNAYDEAGNLKLDELGNPVVVPASTPARYNVAGLASAPVTIKAKETVADDQQEDTDTDTDQTAQLDDNTTDTVADDSALIAENPVSEDTPVQTDSDISDTDVTQTTVADNNANNIWQTPSAPVIQTEKKSSFSMDSYLILVIAIIVVVAWVDIMFILSRRSESNRIRREMELREAEEKAELEESGLRFADIDEDDAPDDHRSNASNYKYKTLSSDGPTAPLMYEDVDGFTEADDPEDPFD